MNLRYRLGRTLLSVFVRVVWGFRKSGSDAIPAGGPVVIEAELGHASLPMNVARALAEELGPEAAQFATYEHLLSGRGLTRLYRQLSGGIEKTGPQLMDGFARARRVAASGSGS